MGLNERLKKLEQQYIVSVFLPVLIIDDENTLADSKHLIGPETVVIIDDIGEELGTTSNT